MENKLPLILILIAIALLVIGIGFYQYFITTTSNEPLPEDDPIETFTYPTTPPEVVTQNFYNWYVGNIIPSEAYKESPLLAESFKGRVTSLVENTELVNDPFYCTPETPIAIDTVSSDIIAERARVTVDSTLSDVEAISFITELIVQGDEWKIDNVVCFEKG